MDCRGKKVPELLSRCLEFVRIENSREIELFLHLTFTF